ncbi:phosphotransferase family protein [Pseudonocardia sp. NPDC049154]|uniref:phosphotransferase family protein n=1 Tax=Pseudonocardia sp. NPDC049154 TaxID=3155501 RepID=UPI003407BBCA
MRTRPEDHIEAELVELLDERGRLRADPPALGAHRSEADVRRGLETWLGRFLPQVTGIGPLVRMSGAGTNELYSVVLESGTESERAVLRIKTPGSGVLTHVGRECRMMEVAAEVMPVPPPRLYTQDPAYFGAPAMLTDFALGVQAPRGQPVRASGMGTRYPEPLRSSLGPQFVRHVAALHARPTDTLPEGFERPRPGTTDALDWRLTFWGRLWDEDRIEEHPTMCLARDWLWENRPPVDAVSLLHGDYRNGNFLFDEESGRITAVIDWEMTWVGDRHADLAYTMFRSFGDREDGRFLVAGLVESGDFTRRYEAESGLGIDAERLAYYFVFNMYWSNVSMLGTGLRNARAGMTQLDVMYQTMMGKGVMSAAALNAATARARL